MIGERSQVVANRELTEEEEYPVKEVGKIQSERDQMAERCEEWKNTWINRSLNATDRESWGMLVEFDSWRSVVLVELSLDRKSVV